MDAKWLSYEELGQALGITPASAKRLATRRKWAKKPGNDGHTRVAVPKALSPWQLPVNGECHSPILGMGEAVGR